MELLLNWRSPALSTSPISFSRAGPNGLARCRLASESKAKKVVILLDCFFSGALGNPPAFDNRKALLREGISILTAGRGDQPPVETGGGGVFTSLVVDALDGGPADVLGAVSAAAIYAYVEAALVAWDQRPLFKAPVAHVLPLRCCTPPIDRMVDLPPQGHQVMPRGR